MTGFGNSLSLAALGLSQKPRVFVSYHHENDQDGYNRFTRLFANAYDIVTDSSLDRRIDSDDAEYVERRIRENYIKGTSLTVVLCGRETWKRRYVDWEICATLYLKHALLGICLPSHIPNQNGNYSVPSRLHQNIESGYAAWTGWTDNPTAFASAMNQARLKASQTSMIVNSAKKLGRSHS